MIAFWVDHIFFIIIQLMHGSPIFSITNAYDNDAQRKSTTLNKKIEDFEFIMNHPIC